MNLFGKKEKAQKPAKNDAPTGGSKGRAETASFTNGATLGRRTMAVVIMGCIVLGVLGFGMSLLRANAKAPVATASVTDRMTPLQQSTGAYAVGFIGAWLSATKTDTAALQPYLTTVPTGLGEVPFEYRNLSVASITPTEGSPLVAVLVAGDIKEQPAGAKTPSWVQRYFEVNVDTSQGHVAAAGLPAPVAGPAKTASNGLGFTNQISPDAAPAQTIQLMLSAYLTGQGRVDSYLTPGVSISPVDPAPFASLEPVSFLTSQPPADKPGDGDRLQVQAAVLLKTSTGQEVTSTYFLHLTARAGRWEVTDLDAVTPPPSNSPTSPSPSPSPTGGTTEGATP